MRLSNLIGERYKEMPAEASLASHIFLLKGGYIRQVSNGIYSLLMPAKRIVSKIENIIRQEMNAIDGQEVYLPVVMPRELWEESGRYQSVGSELARFKDRAGHDMVLGMTHEEAAVHLVRNEASSYLKYPFMIYQIQTKFRDELRSRGGLMRVREFTMKDAYSFHTSQKDLEEYYDRCLIAYDKIFARAGIPEVVAVGSDTGMMGGTVAHEFMLLCDAGEDTIMICSSCDYKANVEAAEGILSKNDKSEEQLSEIFTPDIKDIDSLTEFISNDSSQIMEMDTIKAVVFRTADSDKPLVVFIRGDLDVNEAKLSKVTKSQLFPYNEDEKTCDDGICAGFIGPVGLDLEQVEVVFDKSLEGECNLICGANKTDYHFKGVNLSRDARIDKFYDVSKANDSMLCPKCGDAKLEITRGNEMGHIFQLGDKYTSSMNMIYIDADGERRNPIMGCYGIGVGRLLASVIEARHDDFGPIWPISIAPWQVEICALNVQEEAISMLADSLYKGLSDQGYEVLYDDRSSSAGAKFADADLLGIPVRVVISAKNMKDDCIELSTRDKTYKEQIKIADAESEIIKLIANLENSLK
jgi:prolyl-tRNA synthetase